MQTYFRCLVYNRITLLGLVLFLAGLISILYRLPPDVIFLLVFMGFFFLTITGFGSETYEMYIRTIEHAKKHNKIDDVFEEKALSAFYCARIGFVRAKQYLLKNRPADLMDNNTEI